MSWSLKTPPTQAQLAAQVIRDAFTSQGCYSISGAHKVALDALADSATKVAALAHAEDLVVVESFGHLGDDGRGDASLKVNITAAPAKPVEEVKAPEQPVVEQPPAGSEAPAAPAPEAPAAPSTDEAPAAPPAGEPSAPPEA